MWYGQKNQFTLLNWFKVRSWRSRLPKRNPWQHWPHDLHTLFSLLSLFDSFFLYPHNYSPKWITCLKFLVSFGSSFATSINRKSDLSFIWCHWWDYWGAAGFGRFPSPKGPQHISKTYLYLAYQDLLDNLFDPVDCHGLVVTSFSFLSCYLSFWLAVVHTLFI